MFCMVIRIAVRRLLKSGLVHSKKAAILLFSPRRFLGGIGSTRGGRRRHNERMSEASIIKLIVIYMMGLQVLLVLGLNLKDLNEICSQITVVN